MSTVDAFVRLLLLVQASLLVSARAASMAAFLVASADQSEHVLGEGYRLDTLRAVAGPGNSIHPNARALFLSTAVKVGIANILNALIMHLHPCKRRDTGSCTRSHWNDASHILPNGSCRSPRRSGRTVTLACPLWPSPLRVRCFGNWVPFWPRHKPRTTLVCLNRRKARVGRDG